MQYKFTNVFFCLAQSWEGFLVQLLGSLKDETPKQLLHKHMQQKRKLKKFDMYVELSLETCLCFYSYC